jgi:hypothetical protein
MTNEYVLVSLAVLSALVWRVSLASFVVILYAALAILLLSFATIQCVTGRTQRH